MGSSTLQREAFGQWIVEALPMLERHWREIARHKDIPLNIDIERYKAAERAGVIRVYTARRDGALVGYTVFVVQHNLHYRDSLQALQDVFYVDRDKRGAMIGLRLLKFSDAALASEGVQVVMHHVKLAHPDLGELLSLRGYEPTEMMYSKRLDRTIMGRVPIESEVA